MLSFEKDHEIISCIVKETRFAAWRFLHSDDNANASLCQNSSILSFEKDYEIIICIVKETRFADYRFLHSDANVNSFLVPKWLSAEF